MLEIAKIFILLLFGGWVPLYWTTCKKGTVVNQLILLTFFNNIGKQVRALIKNAKYVRLNLEWDIFLPHLITKYL